jgi:photosystem II stability/assembly factor-like uncharacterized protein
MIDEERLRLRLQRAIGYEPPSSDFGAPPIANLVAPRPADWNGEPQRHSALLALVAAAIAIAVVATLVLGTRALRVTPVVPVHPGPIVSASPPCGQAGSSGPVTMITATNGWSSDPYYTSDGGAHWIKVAPPVISKFSVESEFFLDSSHAWIAEAAGSANAAADHVVVYGTSDSGQTWQRSAPLRINPATPTDVIWQGGEDAHWMCFIDARDGWLLIESGPWNPMSANWRVGALYRTGDGGLNWTLVSANPGSAALKALNRNCAGVYGIGDGMVFASSTTGWLPLMSCASSDAMLMTRDGGATWSVQNEPVAHPELPYFFDSNNGVMFGSDSVAATSDGGITWARRGAVPNQCFSFNFIDPMHGWCILNEAPAPGSGFRLYTTTNGGQTWSRSGALPNAGGLVFVDTKMGYLGAGINPASSDWLFLKTVDGGLTWTRLETTVSK